MSDKRKEREVGEMEAPKGSISAGGSNGALEGGFVGNNGTSIEDAGTGNRATCCSICGMGSIKENDKIGEVHREGRKVGIRDKDRKRNDGELQPRREQWEVVSQEERVEQRNLMMRLRV